MSDDKDKIDVPEVLGQEATPEESGSRGFDDELFTSAEYNFRHLTDGPKPVPQEPKVSSEPPPVIAEASSANHQETSPSNDPVCGEADTSAPPAILPPVQMAIPPTTTTAEDTTEEVDALSEGAPSADIPDGESVVPEEERKVDLPGKDTQSVVVDMGQLNEDAERKAEERAAQRAAFAPLESSGAMERITFSNLAALNFPDDNDELDGSVDGSTVNLHRDDFKMPTPAGGNAEFDIENQTFDADDLPEQTLRRPGRWLFLIVLAVMISLIAALGYSIWNLGKHRSLLTKKPVEAIEMGLGLRAFPKPIVIQKPKPPQIAKIIGRLEVQDVQLDWANDKQSVLVSGRLKNASNVDHERIELTVELFDELQNSLIVTRIKCCKVEPSTVDKAKKGTTDSSNTAKEDSAIPPFHVVKSGVEKPFSSPIAIKKPRRGEVSAKASVSYSEVID